MPGLRKPRHWVRPSCGRLSACRMPAGSPSSDSRAAASSAGSTPCRRLDRGAAIAATAAELGADYVGGLELGAVPIVAATAAMSAVAGRPVGAVFVRKEAKGHGTRSLVEGLAEGEDLVGKRVVVVEDVTTTGGSGLKAIAALRSK